MSFTWFFFCSLLLLTSGFTVFPAATASLGVNYGQIANNLPLPAQVVPLIKLIGATKVKLYDTNPRVLQAFANTNIQVVVGLGNEYLHQMKDVDKAEVWVRAHVHKYLPATNITGITIGNEVLSSNATVSIGALLPAMLGVHAALVKLGLDKQIFVTTAHSLAILENSYPPSAGSFRRDLTGDLCPILAFLSKNGSPFFINAYPYFAYKDSPDQISLDYVLFQKDRGTSDVSNNLHYDNMLFAQIDAVHSALGSVGYAKIQVVVSETGWPSKGDQDELGATPENAGKYNGNLIKLIYQKRTTPLAPSSDLNAYVFALFNENLKPGPTSERNYGLFKPDGTPAYSLGLAGVGTPNVRNTSTCCAPRSSSPPRKPPTSPSPTTSSNGYMSISSAANRCCWEWLAMVCCLSWVVVMWEGWR